jgi:hypothetical protein
MKLGLVGGSYQERSLPFDAQRTVNLYPVVDETGQGKEPTALYGTPGLLIFNTCGIGPIRGLFYSTNGRLFAVSATQLYEVSSSGVETLRGTLITDVTKITMVENTTQLIICDSTNLYTFTYSTNTFAQVTDVDFPDAGTVTMLDGYTIVNKPNSGEFYISAIQNAASWDALDFATAESSPDGLVRVIALSGQLWLFGERTTEVWYNSGDVDFPFSRIEGARIEVGCASPLSVLTVDNSVFWLGKSDKGQGTVYRAAGYSPQRISTFAIEYALGKISDLSDVQAYTYQRDGHLFYILTGGGLETSLAYDVSTGLWHERAYLEEDGTYSTHLAYTCAFAYNKHLVGDKSNGNIYIMSPDYYDDNGREIKAMRTFTHICQEGQIFKVKEVIIDFENGVGLSGENAPQVWLRVSRDGGRTWGNELLASIGALGSYQTQARWRRLGYTNDILTFQVSISDPVKRAICGAYAR